MSLMIICLYSSAAAYSAACILYFLNKKQISYYLIAAGFIVNLAFMLQRGFITGVFIPNGMFEGVFLTPMLMALVILLAGNSKNDNLSYLSAVVPLAVFSIFSLFYPKGIIPPTPNKITIWANLFFLTESAGHACFYIGGWLGGQSLIKKDGDTRYHSILVWGFILFSVSQVAGAIWCFLGWGTFFRWGSRHLQSAVIWCYFAAYLHLRFMPAWNKTKKPLFAAFGIIVTALNSFGGYLHEMGFPRIGG